VTWQGVVAPAGTPREVLLKLNREIAAVLSLADVRDRLLAMGVEPVGGSIDAFDTALKHDSDRYGKAFRDAGIRPE
jgi:tripartite-type tricarboxylate transporter receptor subunit TctC